MSATKQRRAAPVPFVAGRLGLLAAVAGCNDAVSYLALGHVFTANMTGNTVLLSIAATTGDAARLARSLCALGGFCAGAAAAAAMARRSKGGEWPGRSGAAMVLEAVCLAAVALAALLAGPSVYVLIAISGAAMGLQSAVVWLARTAGISSTYITGTITGLVVRAIAPERAAPAPALRTAAGVWLVYAAAACAGAAAAGPWGTWAEALALVPLVAVLGSHLRRGR